MGQRLRQSRRFRYMVDVMLHLPDGLVRAGSLDISQNGMFVYVSEDTLPSERLRLTLSVPTRAEPLNLTGRVAWKTPPENSRRKGKVGVGIELTFRSDEDKQVWEAFIDQVRTGHVCDNGTPTATVKRLKHLHQPTVNLRDEVGTLAHLSLRTIWDRSGSQPVVQEREPSESA